MLFLLCRFICFGCRSWFVTFVNPLFSVKKSKPDDTDFVCFLWSLITAWIFTDQRLYKNKRHVYLIDLSIYFHSVILHFWMAYCHHATIFLELVDVFTWTEIMDYRMHSWRQLALFNNFNKNKVYYVLYFWYKIACSSFVLHWSTCIWSFDPNFLFHSFFLLQIKKHI